MHIVYMHTPSVVSIWAPQTQLTNLYTIKRHSALPLAASSKKTQCFAIGCKLKKRHCALPLAASSRMRMPSKQESDRNGNGIMIPTRIIICNELNLDLLTC